MKKEEFIEAINKAINGRFKIQPKKDAPKFDEIKPSELTDVTVFRIQKIPILQNTSIPLQYWRTILVTLLKNDSQLEKALQWAALVKEALLDPESSDLYLFIIFDNSVNITMESCIRIESTEQFCRKYVARPEESPEQLIERTFLTPLADLSAKNILFDPLISAFSSLESKYPSFNTLTQNKWREAFLSGKNGSEIINELFE